jgi:predicted aspartyl protease
MSWTCRSLLAALLVGTFGLTATAPAGAAEDCRLKQFASIPTTFGADGRVALEVAINDQPAKLLIDTGAGLSFLDRAFVDHVRLPQYDTPVLGYGLTGRPIDRAARVARFALGRAVIHNQSFAIGSVGGDGTDGRPVGIFGANYLAPYDVEIDPVGRHLNLFLPDHCTGQTVYWANEYFRLPVHLTEGKGLEATVQVGGKSVRALLDTGASVTTMRLAIARDLFNLTPPAGAPATLSGVDGSRLDSFVHRFESLTLGGITLHDTAVVIADIDSGKGATRYGTRIRGNPEQPDMLIGMPLLRRLHLFIAYSEPAVYFTLADPAAERH